MATQCNPIRSQLQALEEELRNTPKFVGEQSQGATPAINPTWINLDSHVRRTRMALQVCEGMD